MSSSTRQFRAQAIPTIIMVILVPLFTGLGIWQLDRAEQKRQLSAALESRRKQPALSLNLALPPTGEREFRPVVAQGRYLADKTILIENRKYLGRTGFHVVTPLRIEGSERIVLVNRGWIPRERLDGDARPATPGERVTVHGTLALPQAPAIELQLADTPADTTPHWPYLTLDHFAQWSGLKILPFEILQSPEDPGDLVRQWPQPQFSDAMHIGYAIQWFAFALITLLIWFRLSLQPITPTGASQ
jgi:surfeit locus 1 family protein